MKRMVIFMAAVLFTLSGIIGAYAAPRGAGNPDAAQSGERFHGKGHHGGMHGDKCSMMPFKMMKKLDLTAEQKQQVAAILKNHRAEIESIVNGMAEGNKAFSEAAHANPYDAARVKAAAETLSSNIGKAMVLKAQIMSEVLPILTAEQTAKLEKFKERRAEKMGGHGQRMLEKIDRWIEKNS